MKTNVELISTRVYAGRLKDRENLNNSSSGGAFTALSDFFLKNDNAVVAAIYNYENHTTEFQMILDKDQRERAKGSKYMQSKPGGIFREAYRWLMDNSGKKIDQVIQHNAGRQILKLRPKSLNKEKNSGMIIRRKELIS